MKRLSVVVLSLLVGVSCSVQSEKVAVVAEVAKGAMPALVKDANDRIDLVYGYGDSLMYSYMTADGQTFAPPVLIDTIADLVDYATRGPQLAVTSGGIVVIAVERSGNIYSFVKDPSGKWRSSGRVNDVDTVDKEGFVGISSDGGNNVFAIWPDLRDNGRQKIYGAKSTDGGKTWEKNMLVYQSPGGTVCECCKPSIAMHGRDIYVMFRNSLNGNRDLYLAHSPDGGNRFETAEKLGFGNWKLDGCPMDGGGLAIGENAVPQTVWRRESKIFAAVPGGMEKEIGEGRDCTVETISGRNIYAWTASNGDIVCLLPDGTKKIPGKGVLPVLKGVDTNHVICVWQDNKMIKTILLTI